MCFVWIEGSHIKPIRRNLPHVASSWDFPSALKISPHISHPQKIYGNSIWDLSLQRWKISKIIDSELISFLPSIKCDINREKRNQIEQFWVKNWSYKFSLLHLLHIWYFFSTISLYTGKSEYRWGFCVSMKNYILQKIEVNAEVFFIINAIL